jgi:hypothetical protein
LAECNQKRGHDKKKVLHISSTVRIYIIQPLGRARIMPIDTANLENASRVILLKHGTKMHDK